jgi:transcriptional regulator with PAS, ATPase and Fis domain
MNMTPLGIFITDNAENVVFSNSGLSSISAADRASIENAIAHNENSKFIGGFGQPLKSRDMPVNIVINEKKPLHGVELGYLTKSGKTIWVNISANPHGEKKTGTIVVYYDITDIKNIRNELEISRHRYKKLLSDLPVTLIVHKKGKILYSNSQIYNLLGYKPFEINGDNIKKHISSEYGHIFEKTVKFKQFEIDFNDEIAQMAVIEDMTKQKMLEKDITRTKMQLIDKHAIGDLIGRNRQILDIMNILPGISSIRCNVLLEGETGTGKNMIAKTIHELSNRKKSPFVSLNCAAIPESLFESELFGFVKGAFTDAHADKKGKFALAESGTVFLDEIGEIPMNLQVKLLKVIEEKKFEPLGSVVSIQSDVRIIAATNRDLKKLVKAGKFREDLYYRLKVVSLVMPPLRDRKDDIELLAESFIYHFNGLYSKNIMGMTDEFYKFIYQYDFPGNIRELRNIIERACVFCAGDRIDIKDMAEEYRETAAKQTVYENTKKPDGRKNLKQQPAMDLQELENSSSRNRARKTIEHKIDDPDFSPLEISEKKMLIETLKKFDNDKAQVMKYLNISRMTLWRKLKKYGIW